MKKARGLLTKIYYCSGDVDRASSAMTESTDMRPSGGDAAAALQVCLLSLPHEHVNFNSHQIRVAVHWNIFGMTTEHSTVFRSRRFGEEATAEVQGDR